MKNLLLLIVMFCCLTGNAQISIDVNDMPVIGDNIPRKSDTMTVLMGPGSSGPNQIWNFTNLSPYVIIESTNIVSVASTPNASSFPNSNMAMTNDNLSFLYFNNSAQYLKTQGFSGDLLGTGTPLNAVFSPELTVHQFPRTYTSSYNDTYGIDVTIPGGAINPILNQIHFKRSSIVKDTTDAWGQLTTPNGTYNVLRVHTREIFTDSIWALPIFPPTWSLVSTNIDTTNSYSWLAKGGKLAVAEMSFDTLGLPKIFKWTELPGIGVGLMEEKQANKLYPNPFKDDIYIEGNGLVNIKLYELNGKNIDIKVAEQNGLYQIMPLNAAKGIYILEFKNEIHQTKRKVVIKSN